MNPNQNNHICGDTCKGRKCFVHCYFCDRVFNLKCFGIDQGLHSKLSSSDTFLHFICSQCHSRHKRKSVSTLTSTSSSAPPKISEDLHQLRVITKQLNDKIDNLSVQPPTNNISTDTHQLNANIKTLIEMMTSNNETRQLHETVKQTFDKISALSLTSLAQDHSRQSNNDTGVRLDSEVFTKINNMYSLLIKANDKIDKLHTEQHEKDNMRTITSMLENGSHLADRTNPSSTKFNNADTNKLHEWSMHLDSNNDSIIQTPGRPSLIVQQSVDDDILNILRNSESRTWDSLDRLSITVNDIQSDIKDILSQHDSQSNNGHYNTSGNDRQISSPLLDSIKIDALHQIQSKCDNIERLVTRDLTSHQSSTQSSRNSTDDHSSISLTDNARLHNGTNAVHVASAQASAGTYNSTSPSNRLIIASGNPIGISKPQKEAMTQTNINNVPESSKSYGQKMQKRHNLSANGLGMGSVIDLQSSSSSSLSTSMNQIESDYLQAMIDIAQENDDASNRDLSLLSPSSISGSQVDTGDPLADILTSFNSNMSSAPNSNSTTPHASNQSQHSQQISSGESQPQSSTTTSSSNNRLRLKNAFHLSKFDTSITTETILSYISSKIHVDTSSLKVIRLTKKGQDISKLKYVTFKIETTDDIAVEINATNFWPHICSITPFIQKDVCNLNLALNTFVDGHSNPNFRRTKSQIHVT